MRFFADGSALDVLEHRDLAAMVVAIETLTESAASILGHLPERNRIAAILDPTTRAPGQFLDRQTGTVGSFDADDHEVRLIVDDWGNPLGYMAQRDWKASPATPIKSTNHQADWNQTSTDFVRLNGGAPVIFSWGADGEAQLTKDTMTTTATASLVADWVNDPNDSDKPAINNLMNADNVYANPALKEKLTEGITQ
jgi:hypothetical protein